MPNHLTQKVIDAGHIPCLHCDDFTYVFSAAVLATLPDGYHGEPCPKCGDWMCRRDKIGKKEVIDEFTHN